MMLELLLLFAIYFASVATYFSIWENRWIQTALTKNFKITTGKYVFYTYQKVLGGLLFGLIPVIIYQFMDDDFNLFINFSLSSTQWIVTIALSCIPLVSSYFSTNNRPHLEIYPQLRIEKWTIGVFLYDFVLWAIYLFAYEVLFRSLLFFPLYDYFEWYFVFGINTTLYVLAHLPKGKKEVLAAIPFGFILCAITEYTQSMIPAFLIHLSGAFFNDVYSVYHTKRFAKNNL